MLRLLVWSIIVGNLFFSTLLTWAFLFGIGDADTKIAASVMGNTAVLMTMLLKPEWFKKGE